MTYANVVKNFHELRVGLPMNLLQFVDHLNALFPGFGLEAEALLRWCPVRTEVFAFYDWWKLEEIAAEDQLNAAEWFVVPANIASDRLDFL